MIPVASSPKAEIKHVLETSTVEDFLRTRPPRTVVSVTHETSISRCLKLFCNSQIVSAPVVTEDGKFSGFIDMLDIVSALIERSQLAQQPSSNLQQHISTLADSLNGATVQSLHRADDGQLVWQPHSSMPLLDLVRQGFINPVNKLWCHRLAVFDSDDATFNTGVTITAIISQSDILRHLHRHMYSLPTLMGTSLDVLGFTAKPAVCVPHDMPTLHAYATMLSNDIAAVAVMLHGRLVANLSATDLRSLHASDLHQLALPVLEFLEFRAKLSDKDIHAPHSLASQYGIKVASNPHGVDPPVTCSLESRFGAVLDQFVSQGVHRVYVLEDDGVTLRGVISINDVLTTLCAWA